MSNYPILELSKRYNKLSVKVECPQCGDKYMTHLSYVQVPCRNCRITYKTDFKQSIYTKVAKKLNGILYRSDGVTIKAEYEFEADITHIKEHFTGMKCWDVSELDYKTSEYKRCEKCGTCLSCYTCKECGKASVPDPHKKKRNCVHCKSTRIIRTYFKEVFQPEENKNIRLCPYCKSDRIIMTKSKTKTKCHLCGSKQLSQATSETDIYLTIERKRGYRL